MSAFSGMSSVTVEELLRGADYEQSAAVMYCLLRQVKIDRMDLEATYVSPRSSVA